jgi:hypothetical protein
MKQFGSLLATLSLGLVLAATTQASSFSLNVASSCCGAGPFGSVTLTQNGTNEVDVSVSLLNTAPYLFIDGGQAGAFAFNVDIANANLSITVSAASVAAGFASTVLGNGTFGEHMDGFGSFDYAIAGNSSHTHGGSTPIGQSLTFKVVDTAGSISPADFQENSTGGSFASFFAADIINKATTGAGAGTTGIVGTNDVTTTGVVPEPATFLMWGVGLVAIGLVRRQRISA